MEPEIVVQDPPKSLEREHGIPEARSIEGKDFFAIIDNKETPFTIAKEHLHNELQQLYHIASKMNAPKSHVSR